MTSKQVLGTEETVMTNSSEEMENEELEALLLSRDEEDEFKNEFVDDRLETVTRARSLIMYWHQLHQQLSQIREGYSLAKLWEDDELKNQHMEQGRPLVKKEKILNKVVKDVLSELKDVPFLTQQELLQLPKWMLKILNVRLDTEEEDNADALLDEKKVESEVSTGKSEF